MLTKTQHLANPNFFVGFNVEYEKSKLYCEKRVECYISDAAIAASNEPNVTLQYHADTRECLPRDHIHISTKATQNFFKMIW